jgi:diaminohydroxyphosphoribosylaminopyrimidine deaminase/5-amino-6-(5-phosphoribosylamino)uracil reductase
MFIDDAYSHLQVLSRQGMGTVSPNPNVSAAIYTPDGRLISDGFHNRKTSLDHAEIIALKRAGDLAQGSTMVVSLEPCSHQGRTGPCTEAIASAGISRVIFAVKDPNPLAKDGEDRLRELGVHVDFVESPELKFLQRAWLHKVATGNPLMIWKIATSLDGKIAAGDGTSKWITSEDSRVDVQELRAESDAILIGTNTALVDNPALIPRGSTARPVRIICGEQEIPSTYQIFDEQARTIFVKSKSLAELSDVLRSEGFNQVLVEAGPTFGTALLSAGLIDEIIFYHAPLLIGEGKNSINSLGVSTLSQAISLQLLSTQIINEDIKSHYKVMGR